MNSPRKNRKPPKPRRRRKARKVRLDVLQDIMQTQDWDNYDLVKQTGLSIQTINRLLKGSYIRKDSAKKLQEKLSQFTTASLIEGQPAPPVESDARSSPLETLYQACDRLPVALKQHARVREFSSLIAERTREFVGRQWLFDALDRFLTRNACGYFLIRGKPGVGKTTFAAELTRRRGCIHHFNSRFTGLSRAEPFLAGTCAQVIAAYGLPYGELPARATHDAGYLTDLLAEATHAHPGANILLVVDALDEATQGTDVLTNPLGLPPRLPERCHVVLTARDLARQPRIESPMQTLDLEQQSDGNLSDVKLFLQRQATRKGIKAYIARHNLGIDGFVALLEQRSHGNFMYLRYVLPEIEAGRFAAQDWKELPEGLANYYESHWALLRDTDSAAWFGYKLPILLALVTAREPVSVRLLADRLPHVRPAIIREVLARDWRQFLDCKRIRLGGTAVMAWRLYHASFADFLRRKAAEPEEHVDLEVEQDAWLEYGRQHGITPD